VRCLAARHPGRRLFIVRQFYIRRFLRIFPVYYAVLVLLILAGVGGILHVSPWLFTYTTNIYVWHYLAYPYAVPHFWTLAVEEQFYLVWPALLYLLLALRLSRQRILMLVCAGILASVALRITLYHMHRAPGPDKVANAYRMYMGLDTRADGLLIGCLTGLAATWNLLPRSRRFVRGVGIGALASAATIVYLVLFSGATLTLYFHGLFTVFASMVAVIIIRLLVAPSRLGTLLLESAPLVGIGRISYGLYLYHVLVMHWLEPAEYGWHHPAMTATAAGLSLAAALVSFYCIERPCLRLKDRLGHQTDAPKLDLSDSLADGARLPPPGVAA